MSPGAEGPGTPGRLVVVATPIGNLGDLSPRAVEVLGAADLICCEDTRRTRALLSAAGVPAGHRLTALHGHNERQRTAAICRQLAEGRLVALVSDAGTPAISDPGARLLEAAVAAGLAVSVVPGPSAVTAALVVSGLPSDRFSFEGFLPRRGAERRRRLLALAAELRTTVLFEAPPRLAATLADLAAACGGGRRVAVVRELTKLHEEVWRGTLAHAADRFAEHPVRGEVVVVLEGAPGPADQVDGERIREAVAERLAAGESVRQAAEAVGAALGVPRRQAYEAALAVRDHNAGMREAVSPEGPGA